MPNKFNKLESKTVYKLIIVCNEIFNFMSSRKVPIMKIKVLGLEKTIELEKLSSGSHVFEYKKFSIWYRYGQEGPNCEDLEIQVKLEKKISKPEKKGNNKTIYIKWGWSKEIVIEIE